MEKESIFLILASLLSGLLLVYAFRTLKKETSVNVLYDQSYTKEEMIILIKMGYTFRHKLFLKEECMTYNSENNVLLFEDGYRATIEEFFSNRTGQIWETGWFLDKT